MKFRLILVILMLFVFFVVKAQAPDVIFYSNANMYVGQNYTTSTDPTLYINGSAKFVSAGTEANKIAITQVGTTQLMGDFVDSLATNDATDINKLFTADSYDASAKTGGVILFAGDSLKQRIYREAKNKGFNYVNFPIVRVNQNFNLATDNLSSVGYVAVDTSASISIEDLQIGGAYKGGFAVEASNVPSLPKLQSAYVLIKNLNTGSPATSAGWSRVDLNLYDPSQPTQNVPNYTAGMTDPIELSRRYLTGFSSPFAQLGADYMFFHTLLEPNGDDLTSNKGPILDPEEKLLAGKSYFIAQDVSDFDKEKIQEKYDVKYEDRFIGNYQFSRKVFDEYYANATTGTKKKFSKFKTDQIAEYFNTGSVEVSLVAGINFLGNPFLTPLDLVSVVEPVDPTSSWDSGDGLYDVYRTVGFAEYVDQANIDSVNSVYGSKPVTNPNSNFVSASRGQNVFSPYDIQGRYWSIKNGSIRHESNSLGNWFYYSVNYDIGQFDGGTTSLNVGDTRNLIPPMAMFCLRASSPFKIKILQPDESILKAGRVYAPKSISNSERIVDELLIQALDTETGSEDRMCLVFRDKRMTDANAFSSIRVRKNFTAAIESKDSFVLPEGSLYTKSTTGEPLLTNPVSKDIKQLALYVVPAQNRVKHIKLTPYRMETLESINKVWIEDKLNPGVYQELTEDGVEYAIEPSTVDSKTSLENRFVLYFNELPSDGNVVDDNSFIVYYHGSTLYIKGLIDEDLGSKVDIYDIRGRHVGSTTINDVPTTSYLKPLAHGTYIVKIKGKRNHTSKFISLQN